jgi:hypothetical protein
MFFRNHLPKLVFLILFLPVTWPLVEGLKYTKLPLSPGWAFAVGALIAGAGGYYLSGRILHWWDAHRER